MRGARGPDPMGFDALIEKVRQAETALEARERQTAADVRQLRASWRRMWTPGRILLAGLASGFLVGRAAPLSKAAGGGGVLQLASALSTLFAGSSAQAAADEASQAAEAAEDTTSGVAPDAGAEAAVAAQAEAPAAVARPRHRAHVPEEPQAFRDRGHL